MEIENENEYHGELEERETSAHIVEVCYRAIKQTMFS